jgi:hypothetical protein
MTIRDIAAAMRKVVARNRAFDLPYKIVFTYILNVNTDKWFQRLPGNAAKGPNTGARNCG